MRADSACQGVRAAAAAEEEDGAEGAEMTLARPRARREVMCDRAWMTFVRVFASSSMRFKLRACNEVCGCRACKSARDHTKKIKKNLWL